jgi:hypothetical protein
MTWSDKKYVIKHAKRFGWAATWDVVIWLILATLGPKFLSLDPRLSVRPHVEEWDFRWLTNLLRSIHELPSLGFPFGICIEIETRWWKRCIHTGTWPRLLEVDSSDKPTSTHNEQFRIRERPTSRWRLEPFGVAHGIGQRKVKVVGDHHSASVSHNDVMWLWRRSSRVGKVVHPCRVKSFRKAVSTVMDDLETDAWS